MKSFMLGFCPTLFLGVTLREKIINFCTTLFWEAEAIFGRFGNFPHIVGVWGCEEKLPNLPNLASVSQNAEIFQMQLFNTGPVGHLRVVLLSRNFGFKPKIGIYGHLIFYLLSFWPTVTAFYHKQYTVLEKIILSPIDVVNKIVNAKC